MGNSFSYVISKKHVGAVNWADFESDSDIRDGLNPDEAVAVKAAEIRAQYTAFKQIDSLQPACASIANADIFYTNDKQLKQFSSDETLKVVLIEEAMEI